MATTTNPGHHSPDKSAYYSVTLDSNHSYHSLGNTGDIEDDPHEYDPLMSGSVNDGEEDEEDGTYGTKTQWNTKHIIKIVFGAGIGSLLEFYSFGLVAYFQPELTKAFFPPADTDYDALLLEFTLYGTAFAMRPFGGLLFGYIGDRYGRVFSLRISLLCMVVPTVCFGLLPTYQDIGAVATVLVFVFRLVQGLSVGGEMSTALVYIIEEAPSNMKATLVGYLYAMSCGSYFALIVYALWNASRTVIDEQTVEWTWRFAFISSIVIGVLGVYLRRLLPNSYEFENLTKEHAVLANPIRTMFADFSMEFFVLFCGYLAPPIIYFSAAVWVPAYLSSSLIDSPDADAYDVQLIAGILTIFFIAISGILCDKFFGFYNFVKVFMTVAIVNTFVCYTVMAVSSTVWVISLFQVMLSFNAFGGVACVFWCAVWIPDARIRNTLTGITYNLGMALFVATLFDVQTYLANLSRYYGAMYAGLYVIVMCLITFGGIAYAHNYHTWANYHLYRGVNPHMTDDGKEDGEDEITDEYIDSMNPYSVI